MPEAGNRGSVPVGSSDEPTGTSSRTVLDPWLDRADRVLCVVLAMAMAIMLVASVAQVVTRYVLETTLIGPEEIARYMMTGATFLAIPVLARRRNHIAVDALSHYLPSGVTQVVLARAVLLFETVFLAGFTLFAFRFYTELADSGQFSAGLQIPVAWPVSALFLGTGIGTLMTAAMLVQTFLRPSAAPQDAGSTAAEPVDTPEGGRP